MLRNWGLVYQTSIEEHKHSQFKDFLTSTAWLTDTHMISVFASTLQASALHLSSTCFVLYLLSLAPVHWTCGGYQSFPLWIENTNHLKGGKNSCFSACQILQDGCAGRQFSSDLCQIWKNNKHTCTHRHSAGGGARWDQRPRAAREWCVQLTGPANSQFRRPNSTPEVPLRWHEALWSWHEALLHLIVKLTNRFRVFLFCVFFFFFSPVPLVMQMINTSRLQKKKKKPQNGQSLEHLIQKQNMHSSFICHFWNLGKIGRRKREKKMM